jgi:predicted SAM-dependent methyltransferase
MDVLRLFPFLKEKKIKNEELRLNLGCGNIYLKGWVNVDVDSNEGADLVCNFLSRRNHFDKNSAKEVLMLHSISYLRLWEAKEFLKDIY